MEFAPGTFAPAPQRASVAQMAAAQGRIEAKLMLRHGEQLLLSLIIPAAILIGAAKMDIFGGDTSLDELVPMVFAVAAASAGFTGQAISLAFDRRYGALKRSGASGVPTWTIIAGKIIAVLTTVLVQILVLGSIAFILGWTVSPAGAALGMVALFFGVTAFTSLGLLLGGTQSSEVVLAVSNLIWFVLLGILGWVVYSGHLGSPGLWDLAPSVALASVMTGALHGIVNMTAWMSLLFWTVMGIVGTVRWFRFDG